MATLGGAANAGMADRVGSLTPGKQADLVLLRTDGLGALSVADPVARVVTTTHPGLVETVLVAGQVRKWQGRLTGVDAAATRELLAALRNRLEIAG